MTINQLSCHFLFEGRDWAVLTLSKLHASKTGSIITMQIQHGSAIANKQYVYVQKFIKAIIFI